MAHLSHRLIAIALPAAGLLACGGSQSSDKPERSEPALCADGTRQLSDRLGPELATILQKVAVADPTPVGEDEAPRPPLACVLVYTQVAEEFAQEDLPPDEVQDAGLDHQLAVVVPEAGGKSALHVIEPSAKSPGAVMLTLEVRDVLGDGRPTLIVQQDHTAGGESWRGLRLFTFIGEGRAPREIFDEELKVKTPEGLELVGQWQTGNIGSRRAIIVEGAGTKRIFTYDASAQAFRFDEMATADHNPKPPPAPASGEDAPPAEGATPAPKKAGEPAGAEDLKIPLP